MGLFEKKKKDAKRCPICGKEISFFSGLVIADGRICDDCEKMAEVSSISKNIMGVRTGRYLPAIR